MIEVRKEYPMHKHVAVFGMSFSGSTVFNYCLGSMPGCATINESHWLVDEHPSGTPVQCSMCGSSCAVLTDEFRAQLTTCDDHYALIRSTLGCDVLISSDKELHIYDKLASDRNYFPILLFKDPAYQTLSWLKATKESMTEESINNYLTYWSNKNNNYLQRIDEIGQGLVLETTEFQENPALILETVCERLGIAYDGQWEKYWEIKTHTIGGNYSPYSLAERGEFEKLRVTSRRPTEIPDIVAETVFTHLSARATLDQLNRRFHDLKGKPGVASCG